MSLETYFYKTPFWIRWFYPHFLWRIKTEQKSVFLTFDDGPTPEVTDWVIETLSLFNAKATFFCLGKNVEEHPPLFQQLIKSGHSIGNHSFAHEDGWQTNKQVYLNSVLKAGQHIESKWFRPPYGKIKRTQAAALLKQGFKIVMWDVVSGDFNENFSVNQSIQLLLKNTRPGSILVFHDSHKAFPKLKEILPLVMTQLQKQGYSFEVLPD